MILLVIMIIVLIKQRCRQHPPSNRSDSNSGIPLQSIEVETSFTSSESPEPVGGEVACSSEEEGLTALNGESDLPLQEATITYVGIPLCPAGTVSPPISSRTRSHDHEVEVQTENQKEQFSDSPKRKD